MNTIGSGRAAVAIAVRGIPTLSRSPPTRPTTRSTRRSRRPWPRFGGETNHRSSRASTACRNHRKKGGRESWLTEWRQKSGSGASSPAVFWRSFPSPICVWIGTIIAWHHPPRRTFWLPETKTVCCILRMLKQRGASLKSWKDGCGNITSRSGGDQKASMNTCPNLSNSVPT